MENFPFLEMFKVVFLNCEEQSSIVKSLFLLNTMKLFYDHNRKIQKIPKLLLRNYVFNFFFIFMKTKKMMNYSLHI